MKETYYFSHDYNARNDRKMQRLIMKQGVEGVGIFWCIVEMLYEEGGSMPLSECERIAFEIRTDIDKVSFVIINSDLFENDGEFFWSNSVNDRLNKRKDKSVKAKDNANKRWGLSESRIKAEMCIFYVLEFYCNKETFIKCGITSESISRRYSGKTGKYNYKVLYQCDMPTVDAINMESIIKKNAVRYEPIEKFGGYLECYSIESKKQIIELAMQCECDGNAIKDSKPKETKPKETENAGKTEEEILKEIFEQYKDYFSGYSIKEHCGRLLNTTPETLEKLMAYFLLVNGKQITVECKTKYAAEKYFINWAKKEANKQEALNNYNRIFKPKPKQ